MVGEWWVVEEQTMNGCKGKLNEWVNLSLLIKLS